MTETQGTSSIARVLESLPLFRGCTPASLEKLAHAGTVTVVAAGEYVFRQGDVADSMAIVRSGRLEICFESADGGETIATRAGPGSVVGELALLAGAPRSASVRAVRDTELLTIERAAFDEVLACEPSVGLAIARNLGARLQVSVDASRGTPRPSVIAFVTLTRDLQVERLVNACRDQLRTWGTVECLDETTAPPFSKALDRAERESDSVLLVAKSDADPDWRRFCAVSADRVAVLVGPDARESPAALERVQPDVVFLGTNGSPVSIGRTLDTQRARAHHIVRAGAAFDADVARMLRRLTGRAVALVLSGGGARGIAHLGVIERLLAAGVEVDAVGGCSMGAYIGAMFGLEWTPERMIATCRRELVQRRPFNDYTVPRTLSLIRARKARAMLERTFHGTHLEELPRPTFVVSSDLDSGELVVHSHGRVSDAVGASMSIPGIAPPLASAGRLLVDGGLVDNLPVQAMRDREDGGIIAVDVMRYYERPAGSRALPSIVETLMRATFLGSRHRATGSRAQADALITPAVNDISLLQFDRFTQAIAAGRRAADQALERGLLRAVSSVTS